MNVRAWVRLLALSAALAVGSATAHAQAVVTDVNTFASDVRNYNLISFGAATFNNFGDTQGPLAINGNLTLNGGSVANQPTNFVLTSDPTLYVTGQLSLTGGTTDLNSGYASLPGLSSGSYTWSSSSKQLTGGGGTLQINSSDPNSGNNPLTNPTPSNWNWTTLQSSLQSVSNDLASATSTGTISVSGQNLVFSAPNGVTSGDVVFTLDASLLGNGTYNGQTVSSVAVNVPTGMNYIVNVINAAGTTLFAGMNGNSGTNDGQLLWNIEGSGTVNLGGGSFYGSVLAPSATITNDSNTIISGQVVAASFSDSNDELHETVFSPASVAVPEASTYALAATAICGGCILLRSRRRQASLR